MAKKDIEIGVDAAEKSEPKSFDPSNSDARKKRIEEARKLLEENPPEDEVSPEEEKPAEDPETTALGLGSAVLRGTAPTLVESGIGAIGGGIAGGIAGLPAGGVGAIPGALAGARIGATATPLAGQLSDLAVTGVNAAFGTHYTGPKEAVTHFLDKIGVPEPKSSAEKITEAVSQGAAEMYGGAGAFKAAGKLMKGGKAKAVFELMGEKPSQQAVVGGIASGEMEKVKEEGGGTLEQLGKGLGLGILAGTGLSALTPSVKAGLQSLKAVDVPLVEKAANVLRDIAAPQKSVAPTSITETAAKALRGKEPAKIAIAEAAKWEVPIQGLTPSQVSGELGLEQVPQEFLTGSREYQALARKAATTGESEIARRQQEFLGKLSDKGDEILSKAGSKQDLSGLSDELKESILNQVKSYNQAEDELYNEIAKKVDVSSSAEAKNALSEVEKRLAKLKGNEAQLSPIEKSIKEFLSPKKSGELPSIESIYDLKKKVGAFLDKEYTFPTETIAKAKKYYGLLNKDYFNALARPEFQNAAELTKEANSLTVARKKIEDNAIDLFGEKLGTSISGKISRATQAAAKGDAEKIRGILNSVPEAYRPEVVASGMQNAITKQGRLDIDSFVKWYGNLKNQKAAYNALFEQLPSESKYQIDNLYRISENIQKAMAPEAKVGDIKEALNKSVGYVNKIKSIGTGLIAGYITHEAARTLGAPEVLSNVLMNAVTGATVVSSMTKSSKAALQGLDEFLTSGEFAKYVAQAKGNPEIFNKNIPQLMREPVYKKFAKEVGPEAAKTILFSATRTWTPEQIGQPVEQQ
jgi:hypothetical protein